MHKPRRLFHFLAPVLLSAMIFLCTGCVGTAGEHKPGGQGGESLAKTGPEEEPDRPEETLGEEKHTTPVQDTPSPVDGPPGPEQRTESTFEHKVEMDIEGRVETGRGEEWWDIELKNGEEWWDLD